MGNGIAGVVIERRKLGVIESPFPQRKVRVEDGIEEGTSEGSFDGYNNDSGSSIDIKEAPTPQHQPWSEFTAANLLPSSVYLWACDERQPGESRPSRSDALVAWIVLITQMFCYIQLMVVSSTKGHKDDTTNSSSANEGTSESTNGRISPTANGGSYSLVSVAAAMYLMTSIASADLSAGIALLSEARSEMTTSRWIQRKTFGLMLLASFVLLAAASIKVLFYSSSEDVDLVVGAATILFIADVDEKVMVVLKAIPSKWRLFWVLEVVGLSAALALLGLRATDHGEDVSENDQAGCTYGNPESVMGGCFVYSWHFILDYHPLTVTLISLLVNALVASPKEFVKKNVFGKVSRQDWLFAVALALWILQVWSFYFYFEDRVLQGWMLYTMFLLYVVGLACKLSFVCRHSVCCQGSDQPNAYDVNFRWATPSTRFGLLYFPTIMLLVGIVLAVIAVEFGLIWSGIDVLDTTWDSFFVPDAFYAILFDMWLVWCVHTKDTDGPEKPSPEEALNAVVPRECNSETMVTAEEGESVTTAVTGEYKFETESHEEGGSWCLTRNLLLGWIQANVLFSLEYFLWELFLSDTQSMDNRWAYLPLRTTYTFAWTLVGMCAACSNTKGVAFWTIGTYMLDIGVFSMYLWVQDDGSVKLDNF